MNYFRNPYRPWGKVLTCLCLIAGVTSFWTCHTHPYHSKAEAVDLMLDWNKFMLDAEIGTEGYRGPVAARAYGYVGIAAYEAALPAMEGNFSSLTDQFPLLHLPSFPTKNLFNVEVALNACYSDILGKFFMTSTELVKQEKGRLEQRWTNRFADRLDSATIEASETYGRLIAEAVYDWSASDSLGFQSNHHNYERGYIAPVGEGLWVTSKDFPMPPLLPYWGKVRPFIIHASAYQAKELPAFSTAPNTLFYQQAMEIVSLSKPLSTENKWIADFWNDDRPGLTWSPAGHWLAITNEVIEKSRPSMEKSLETYLKVGMALSDAMIACFSSKYIFNLERPETFIQDHIDKNWRPYSPTPSFPSYPSGHAMMGAAAAEILTDMYGPSFKLKDCSHDHLENFQVKARTFNSFEDMARENAISRVFLGVHWRFDCEEGLRLGSQIGKQVAALKVEQQLER